jgi:hypothetical protein
MNYIKIIKYVPATASALKKVSLRCNNPFNDPFSAAPKASPELQHLQEAREHNITNQESANTPSMYSKSTTNN